VLCWGSKKTKKKKPLNCYPLSSTKQKKKGLFLNKFLFQKKEKLTAHIYIIYYLKYYYYYYFSVVF